MEGGYQKQNELNRKHFSLLLKRISKHSFNSRLAHLPHREKWWAVSLLWIVRSDVINKLWKISNMEFVKMHSKQTCTLDLFLLEYECINIKFRRVWRWWTPLSTIFQLYDGGQFNWWKKPQTCRKSLTICIRCCIEWTSLERDCNCNVSGDMHK